MLFPDKSVLVTGAGSGIGRASALRFAQEGARVAVGDRDRAAGEETVALIRDAGGEATFVQADVSVAADVEAMIRAVITAFSRLDVLHNNAGITPSRSPAHELDEADWDRVMNTNLKGAWLVAKYAIPEIIRAGAGSAIVNTASLAGLRARPYRVHYDASKAGVISLTRGLAMELAPHGIRVNCVCPGGVETPGRSGSILPDEEADRLESIARLPAQRLARPGEIANAVLFLASDLASHVNGHALVVDGGEWAGSTVGLVRQPASVPEDL